MLGFSFFHSLSHFRRLPHLLHVGKASLLAESLTRAREKRLERERPLPALDAFSIMYGVYLTTSNVLVLTYKTGLRDNNYGFRNPQRAV